MMAPIIVTAVFALAMIVLGLVKPQAARIVFGVFFLLMALGVNLPLLLTDPTLYVLAGKNALLPIYRWFFSTVLAWKPAVFVILLIAYETTAGVLILARGKWARYGLAGGMIFCLGITPVGMEEISAPLLALALALLLRRTYERSPVELAAARFLRHAAVRAQQR